MTENPTPARSAFSRMSPDVLLRLGGDSLAYIRSSSRQDQVVFYVHAADGTGLMETDSRELAEAAVRQHGLEPVSVH